MRGILLAGGSGTRLGPLTRAVNKHLLPVYDRPMIYYPLSLLMMAGIRDVLVISTPEALPAFCRLLGTGSQWGMNHFHYAKQENPEGIAQALLIGEDFLEGGPCCLVLGDNLLWGDGLGGILRELGNCGLDDDAAYILAAKVASPGGRYGVVELDDEDMAISIEEKPDAPRSHWAVPGVYFYGRHAVGMAKRLRPSPRGELEITDLNRAYLEGRRLSVWRLPPAVTWLDMGTPDALLEASVFAQLARPAGPDDIAREKGWIA